jgi:hypothetical protein
MIREDRGQYPCGVSEETFCICRKDMMMLNVRLVGESEISQDVVEEIALPVNRIIEESTIS